MNRNTAKQGVHDYWNSSSCGEDIYLSGSDAQSFQYQAQIRYELEPYISEFARFELSRGLKVLEIGVGLGADHQKFAEAGADLYGIDLTERAVSHTGDRLALMGLTSNLSVGDAENLTFSDDTFDTVYSWGVLHHTPNTPKAIHEVYRVLRPGGQARVMIYHTWSMVGFMLWMRYALFVGRPWRSLKEIYDKYLESPGTKAYSKVEAHELFKKFSEVRIKTVLTHGDLLESQVGQRHRGIALSFARRIWPRRIIRGLLPGAGLFMLVEATK